MRTHVECSHLCLFVLEIRELCPASIRDSSSRRVIRDRRVQRSDVLSDGRLILLPLIPVQAILFRHQIQDIEYSQRCNQGMDSTRAFCAHGSTCDVTYFLWTTNGAARMRKQTTRRGNSSGESERIAAKANCLYYRV